MTETEYTKHVLNLKSPHFNPNNIDADLLHAILGISTEAGELVDFVKRAIFYGKKKEELDMGNLVEEVGDCFYYIALLCSHLGVSFEDVMQKNIQKLQLRYPDKFNTNNAYKRNLGAEQAVFEHQD